MKSATFDNGRGFALGYNEAAPSPFVTWQFTETENGQRDYYWGHYHSDGQIAEKDFAKRIDDYKELFQVQERTGPLTLAPSRSRPKMRLWRSSTLTSGAWWRAVPCGHGAN